MLLLPGREIETQPVFPVLSACWLLLGCELMLSRGIKFAPAFVTPPPTPVRRHYIGDPDTSLEVSETTQDMATGALKLPEFWESAAAAWFAHAEAQFVVRGVVDDDTRYYYVVASLSSFTASKAVNFITAPPPQGKYAGIKAHLLRLFELSPAERAGRLLDLPGLGDRKPSEHMEMMLNLLGTEHPSFLFRELFLRHMPPHVRTALASSTTNDPRALAAEADRYFLASQQHHVPDRLAPVRARASVPGALPRTANARASPERADGLCFFHARFGAKAKRCRAPCTYSAPGNDRACAQ